MHKHKKEEKSYQTKLSMFIDIKKKDHPSAQKEAQVKEEEKNQHIQRQKAKQNTTMEQINEKQKVDNHHQNGRKSSLSAKSDSPSVEVISKKQIHKPPEEKKINVAFYLNQSPSQPYGQYIDRMHTQWYNNYQKLQRDHSFIQWIFPNSFQSRFNHHAKPLSSQQAEEFRTNPLIIKRYLKSYDMMLAFYGMKLKDKHTGELTRSRHPNYKERFYKTLITSWHNHMRITRILCSLTQTGFGLYASQLCKFLKFQIYDPKGEMTQLRKYNVYKEWQPFQHFQPKLHKINVYLQKINHKEHHEHHKANELRVPVQQNLKQPRSKSLERSPAYKPS